VGLSPRRGSNPLPGANELIFLNNQGYMIEVEIRSFITDDQYKKLLSFFRKNAKLIKKDFQVTVYFSGKYDLRIQRNNKYAKLWLKSGRIHDVKRKEMEIFINRKDFFNAIEFFYNLGFKVEIVWLRKRYEFKYKGIKVCVDDTIGYGKIIELEIKTRKESESVEKRLEKMMNMLGIEKTPREIFERRFKEYKKSWKKLIGKEIKKLKLQKILDYTI